MTLNSAQESSVRKETHLGCIQRGSTLLFSALGEMKYYVIIHYASVDSLNLEALHTVRPEPSRDDNSYT